MRASWRTSLKSLLLAGILLFLASCQPGPTPPEVLKGRIFGTFYEVSIRGDLHFNPKDIKAGIQEVLEEVDRQMSTYRNDSVLNQLNKAPINEWVDIPEELYYVLKTAQTVSEQSNGAFDVTVGGLVNLWGFGPEGQITQAPNEEELLKRLGEVGFQQVQLHESAYQAKRTSDVFVDLSGIAKGFGVDQVSDYLNSQGIHHFLVNIGGDLRAAGMRNKDQVWRVGIEVPTDTKQVAQHILPVTDLAFLGSGDYRNYFESEGVRYSHTIDPTTGRPISHQVAAVHVLMPLATEADAWATAFMVLGDKKGLALANELEIAVLFIKRVEGAYESEMSEVFRQEHAAQLVVPTVL